MVGREAVMVMTVATGVAVVMVVVLVTEVMLVTEVVCYVGA